MFMPPGASTVAAEVDLLYYFIYWVSVFFFIVITVGTLWFAIRYRRKPGETSRLTPGITHHLGLEVFWTVIPTILMFVIFVWGFRSFMHLMVIPGNAMEIKVDAKQWDWYFKYNEGIVSPNKLVVPVGKPIKLLMKSRDVIHSFYIPDYRVKWDVVPNRYSSLWFEALEPGEHDIFCTEFCGNDHSRMIARVHALTPEAYARWLKEAGGIRKGETCEEFGKRLYVENGCNACHTVDGSPSVGPSWKGIWGSLGKLADGSTVKVDENYIRESILEPEKKIVKGYKPQMSSFAGLLDDEAIGCLIEFIKAQGATSGGDGDE